VLRPTEPFLLVLKLREEVAREISEILVEPSIEVSKFPDHPFVEVMIDERRAAKSAYSNEELFKVKLSTRAVSERYFVCGNILDPVRSVRPCH